MLNMRDVSSWQGALTVSDIRNLGVQIIAIKFTEGTGYLSPVAQSDWVNAEAAGDVVRMAYHFFHPSVSVPGQVRFFLDSVKNAGLESGDMLMLDLESTDGMPAMEVAAAAREFCSLAESEVHAPVIVYTYINFAETGNCDGLGNNPLFIADPSSPPGKPRVPHPWSLWSFHQYGVIRGIDADLANFGTVDQLAKLGVFVEPPPPPADVLTISLTDGKIVKETHVHEDNLRPGFLFEAGDAKFRIV